MKLVVIGGTGLLGSHITTALRAHGHEAIAASPDTGVNTLTGEGLAEVLDGASAVIDVSNAPAFDAAEVLAFFTTSTRNLLAVEADAGVGHHVAVSIVGADTLPDSGYMRGKVAQEELIEAGPVPWTVVRSTQFDEFVVRIADDATDGDTVRLPSVGFQPVAVADLAKAVAKVAVGDPVNGRVEVAGPEQFRFDELVQQVLVARGDPRRVVADPDALYFGARLVEGSLVPAGDAVLGETRIEDWLAQPVPTR